VRTLVVDVGTTGLRAAVIHDDGSITDLHHEPCPPDSPAGGLVEFDATVMRDTMLAVARRAIASGPVDAVGVATQRASTVAWRASTGVPLGPALGWQDLRTIGDCIGSRERWGTALAPNQSATKAAWLLATHVPDEASRADPDIRIGTVDSWIVWCLTGGSAHVTDHTNAAITGLMLPDASGWNADLVSALGLHLHQLPRIVDSAGWVGDAVSLPGSPPVTALVGDQQSSLLGQGCITAGRTKITFGTGGMLDTFTGPAPTSARRSANGTFPIVAWSRHGAVHWGLEAIMLAAGSNIEWLVHDLGIVATPPDTADIAATVPDSGGLVWVPALSGLGTPHWDHGARGTLLGATRGTTRAHLVRAVLEGVAHRGADLVAAAEADAGLTIPELRIDGGMSRNNVFIAALADATGRPVRVSSVTEATVRGAGFLAGCEVGQWSDLADTAELTADGRLVEPAGPPGISRGRWAEAVDRARGWIPELSALDF